MYIRDRVRKSAQEHLGYMEASSLCLPYAAWKAAARHRQAVSTRGDAEALRSAIAVAAGRATDGRRQEYLQAMVAIVQ